MNLALVRDCAYHVDFLRYWIHFLNRCFPLWGITSALRFIVPNSSFITPENICVFRFGLFLDVRKFIFQPVLNSNVVPLIRSFYRFLRSEPPAFQIFANRTDRHVDSKQWLDVQFYCLTSPERKRKFQLIRTMIDQIFLYLRFLMRRQMTATSDRTTSLVYVFQLSKSKFFPTPYPLPHGNRVSSDNLSNFCITFTFSALIKANGLLSPFGKCDGIYLMGCVITHNR